VTEADKQLAAAVFLGLCIAYAGTQIGALAGQAATINAQTSGVANLFGVRT
jgi:hypothetical protein